MGERSRLLYDLERALQARGMDCDRLNDVPAVRSMFPGYQGAFNNTVLRSLIETVNNGGSLESLMKKPKKLRPAPPRMATMRSSEMRALYIKGEDVSSIALAAGVSRSRVYAVMGVGFIKSLQRYRLMVPESTIEDLLRVYCGLNPEGGDLSA